MIYENWKKDCIKKHISEDNIRQKDLLFDQMMSDINQTNNKLLLVGSIQSGKTATYMGLIAKLFETNKSNLCILFCGVTNKLKEQTFNRFYEAFHIDEDIKIHKSISGIDNFDEIYNDLQSGKKVLIISIKHYQHIKRIAAWFNKTQPFIKNSLVIDDEGDQASFYNLLQYSRVGEHSATYKAFLNFFQLENCCTFLSVTATPYAHILVHKDLFQLDPKYVYLIPEGESYQSYSKLRQYPEIFHFLNEEDIAELEIAKDEAGYSQLISLPTSLKDAVIKYFINHKRYYYDVKKKPFQSQMIINIDRKIGVHFATKRMLNEFLQQFEMSYDLRKATIDRLYPNVTDEVKKQYISYALDVINSDDYELRPVNCANSEEKNREIEELIFSKQCNIIIGSLTLARGISFPTLLSFYYINEKPKKYTMDNIIQVCRFLGYRKMEIPFFSLWFSDKINDVLIAMFDADDAVRERIEYFQRTHTDFREFARALRIQIKSNAQYSIIGTRETVSKQRTTKGVNNLLSDASFDFKSQEHIDLNDNVSRIFKLLVKQYIQSDKHPKSIDFGPHFNDYPYLEFKNYNDLLANLKLNGINNPGNIFKEYFKTACFNEEILDQLCNTNYKVVVALLLYDFNDKTGTYTARNIHYYKERKEYSYYKQGYRVEYIGDNNWSYEFKKNFDQDVIFIQFYAINPPVDYSKIFEGEVIKLQFVLPVDQNGRKKESLIIAKDEEIGKLENDKSFN